MTSRRRRYLVGLAAMAIAAVAVGARQLQRDQAQPIHRDPEGYARGLETRERVERMQVDRVVAALQLKPGQSVADLGSGSGLFTRPLAKAVGPAGTVFAVDIDAALLRIVERSAVDAGIGNIRTVQAKADDPAIPEPVDLIFICDTFHHLPDKPAYARALLRDVKAGGRVAIIDFASNWPSGHEAMTYSVDDLTGWMTAAGFVTRRTLDFPAESFFVIFGRNP